MALPSVLIRSKDDSINYYPCRASSLVHGREGTEPEDYYAEQTAKAVLKLHVGSGSWRADKRSGRNMERCGICLSQQQ